MRGRLVDRGWGARQGFPGLVPRPDGGRIRVHVLCSPDLPAHWARLDRFEGPEYERVVVPVEYPGGGTRLAYVYALRIDPEEPIRGPGPEGRRGA